MQGKVVVITGATSGIGQVAAKKLAAMGARIVQVARDKTRGEAALERLRQVAPGTAHSIHYADLSSLAQMKQVAAATSPDKGAATIVSLASSPEVAKVSGGYFFKCRPATPTRDAQDDNAAQRLWMESAKLAGWDV